jgi:hypothetical protein
MQAQTKDDLDELETLREQALFGEEEQREQAHKAYEELRDKLFCNEECHTPEGIQSGKKDKSTENNILTCETCGAQFTYLAADRHYYEGQGIDEPTICIECRRDAGLDKSELKGEGESGANGGFNS